jgi:hypothetical protein
MKEIAGQEVWHWLMSHCTSGPGPPRPVSVGSPLIS